ncbi:nucleotide exchange factor GrpE [Buchnera aphidicola (Muscaphis stroyani)]|uniref:Protein GrpE n=1 Tax=Buchnera aphidicola (Muscaphis stroyani) TaxID=1241869 RepID=A0A4D6YCR7_9GAMM|nr:nucleotide exchange factor GrpE [Buchnera aphidicola]QCI24331.1 nucleotide exchange factor GrpE [Buchnera aphidicola (Muscaphis stroyani)]
MTNKEEKKEIKKNLNQEYNQKDKKNNCIDKTIIQNLEDEYQKSKESVLNNKINSELEITKVKIRLENEINKCRNFSLEKIILDFINIVDNVERAKETIKNNKEENYIKIKNQLSSILSDLNNILKIFNIKKIDNIDVLFDPSVHQAMCMHYSNELEPNKIVKVMQPGYILNKHRLLRPAMVIVSKKENKK